MRNRFPVLVLFLLTGTCFCDGLPAAKDVSPLPGTKPLTMTGDIASQLVEGVDRFLLAEIGESIERRGQHWNRNTSSPWKRKVAR